MAGSTVRQLDYLFRRHLLRRRELLAAGLPLGMRFHVEARDDVGRRLFKRGTHEPHILARLQSLQLDWNDSLCVDAGANLGWYSVLFDRLSGGRARVLACEPDPGNAARLRRNLALNAAQQVTVLQAALSDEAGVAGLHRYRDINLGRHSLQAHAGGGGVIEVPKVTLDGALAALGLDILPIAVLKADVEGHEPELLRGAQAALQRCRVLVLEWSPMYHAAGAAQGLVERLSAAGFAPQAWLAGGWRPMTGGELLALRSQCDTLWTARSGPAGGAVDGGGQARGPQSGQEPDE